MSFRAHLPIFDKALFEISIGNYYLTLHDLNDSTTSHCTIPFKRTISLHCISCGSFLYFSCVFSSHSNFCWTSRAGHSGSTSCSISSSLYLHCSLHKAAFYSCRTTCKISNTSGMETVVSVRVMKWILSFGLGKLM